MIKGIEIRKSIKNVERSFFCYCNMLSPKLGTSLMYFKRFRKPLHWSNPKNINEKLSVLKLKYNKDALVSKCADKYSVREYIKECGLEQLLVPLITSYDDVEQIEWEKLPKQFAMKWSFGSGFNIICTDKKQLNIEESINKLKSWEKVKYGAGYGELFYRKNAHKIIVEKYIAPADKLLPPDYKFYCFNGQPQAILYIDRENHSLGFFDTDWKYLSVTNKGSYDELKIIPSRPDSLQEMIRYAKILAKPFPFVRVDFYWVDDHMYFGELTFSPGGGMDVIQCKVRGVEFGELLKLD